MRSSSRIFEFSCTKQILLKIFEIFSINSILYSSISQPLPVLFSRQFLNVINTCVYDHEHRCDNRYFLMKLTF